jgi:hypothetical protein
MQQREKGGVFLSSPTSKWQTRKPTYRTSLERWRRYEAWLDRCARSSMFSRVYDGPELNAGTAPTEGARED